MASFSALKSSQKLLMGGILGTCFGVFMLNGASADLQRRRLKAADNMIRMKQVSPNAFQVKDGQIVIPPALQNAHPSFASSPFLEDTWNGRFINGNLVTSRANIMEGRWYTLLTSGFNHASIGHLVFNMIALSSIVPPFIGAAGTPAFLAVWIISGLSGSAAALGNANLKLKQALKGDSPNAAEVRRYAHTKFVGASGSLLGIFAASAVLYPQTKWQIMFIPYGIQARTLLGVSLAGSLIADATNLFPYIGHWGHIGGMVSGLIVGLMLKNKPFGGRAAMVMALTYSEASVHTRGNQNKSDDEVCMNLTSR